MDSMKKFRIGSGLQNFHIRSPLIQPYIAYSFYNSLWHRHPDCHASCWLIFLLCVCFASIYVSTAAKSYILNHMWTAANFIIEGRMRQYDRRLCTVALNILKACVLCCGFAINPHKDEFLRGRPSNGTYEKNFFWLHAIVCEFPYMPFEYRQRSNFLTWPRPIQLHDNTMVMSM